MGGAPAPGPMDGASGVPQGPDPMAGDTMGGDTMGGGSTGDPMANDPSMGGDPMGGDVPPDGDGMLDPDMGGDPMGSDADMEGGEEGDDSTMSIINQLSPEDREAVRSYAESMLSRDESQGGPEGGPDDMGGEEPPMDGGPDMGPDQGGGQPPMMERVVFTKKQLRKLNEALNIIEPEKEDKNKGLEKKKGKSVNRKSPFNSPKFK